MNYIHLHGDTLTRVIGNRSRQGPALQSPRQLCEGTWVLLVFGHRSFARETFPTTLTGERLNALSLLGQVPLIKILALGRKDTAGTFESFSPMLLGRVFENKRMSFYVLSHINNEFGFKITTFLHGTVVCIHNGGFVSKVTLQIFRIGELVITLSTIMHNGEFRLKAEMNSGNVSSQSKCIPKTLRTFVTFEGSFGSSQN